MRFFGYALLMGSVIGADCLASGAEFKLMDDKVPACSLVVKEDAGPVERHAAEIDPQPEFLGARPHHRLDIGKRVASVDCRLAHAEQVEIGAVEDEDCGGHGRYLAVTRVRRKRWRITISLRIVLGRGIQVR